MACLVVFVSDMTGPKERPDIRFETGDRELPPEDFFCFISSLPEVTILLLLSCMVVNRSCMILLAVLQCCLRSSVPLRRNLFASGSCRQSIKAWRRSPSSSRLAQQCAAEGLS